MTEKLFKRIVLRRRFFKRILFAVITIAISCYISVLLFGDLRSPRVMHLTELSRCPVCYGVSVCPELYSNQIELDQSPGWRSLFNDKNIYHGLTKSSRRVVMKKLAHNWELKKLDENLCKMWNFKEDCKPIDLLNATDIDDKIIDTVIYNFTWPGLEPKKIHLCPFGYSIFDLLQPILNSKKSSYKSDLINVWTMLNINPEPIILQILPKSQGWPVPAFGGVCGRLEVVAYEGEPLSSLTNVDWHRKLKYAKKILHAALDFTFKHDRFRFYFMDWSLDNIVVNERDEITFVDLEDVVILDKHISPNKDFPDWYQRYNRDLTEPGFTVSVDHLCKHHLSDHNLWAACYILAGDDHPFLYPIPKDVNASRPHLFKLLNECLNGRDKFSTISKLQHVIACYILAGDENSVNNANNR